MVKYFFNALDLTFSALGDPIRRGILLKLTHGKISATELAKPFQVSLPAISKHLRVLENAGLIAREKEGRIHRFHIVPGRLKEASHWINRYRKFWEGNFDALEKYLDPIKKEKKHDD